VVRGAIQIHVYLTVDDDDGGVFQVLTERSIKVAIELLLLSSHPYVHTQTDRQLHRQRQGQTHTHTCHSGFEWKRRI